MVEGKRAITVAAALAVLPILGGLSSPAWADFGDCAAPGYLAPVEDRAPAGGIDCDEDERFTITTPEGPREVRIVVDATTPPTNRVALVGQLRRGIEASAAALMAIGEGAPDDVTVWAADLSGVRGAFEDNAQAVRSPDGCQIAFYAQTPGPGGPPFTIAHEFFHCVQFAAHGENVYRDASAWWVEGTAEWFANVAIPGSSASAGYVAAFDAVSPDTALTAMETESVVFFFWLSEEFGLSMPFGLMRAMPTTGGESAQRAALASFLAPDDFQRFAEAYMDRDIHLPGGGPAGVNPFPGNTYVWRQSREHEMESDSFVLHRANLEFQCGNWEITRHEEQGTWHVSRDEGPWEEMPEEVSSDGETLIEYRLAAFSVKPDGLRLRLEAERDACHICPATVAPEDPAYCLVGTWTLASGGMGAQIGEMLRGTGLYETMNYPDLDATTVFGADGTFSQSAGAAGGESAFDLSVRSPDGEVHQGFGTLGMERSGWWEVDGETLHLCFAENRVRINETIVPPDGPAQTIDAEGGPDPGGLTSHRQFTCDGGTLTMVESLPMAPTIEWIYTRGGG